MKKRIISILLSLCMVLSLAQTMGFVEAAGATGTVGKEMLVYTGSSTEINKGDMFWFGSYPQTEIVDKASSSGTYGKVWETDSDYYADIFLYLKLQEAEWDANGDTTIDGVKYHKLKKSDTTSSHDNSGRFSWGNKEERYFRYEPIKWRVLDKNGDDLFVFSDVALDTKVYNKSESGPIWENSDIRSWLNDEFYNRAFSLSEQSFIMSTNVENEDTNTIDKVFLLSKDDVCGQKGANYGFNSDAEEWDPARQIKSSTYAKAMGIEVGAANPSTRGNSGLWLRTKYDDSYVYCIRLWGYVNKTTVINNSFGVCPAMHINLKSNDQILRNIKTTKDVKLSATDYEYDGNEHKSSVSIGGLVENVDYKVSYTDCISPGTVTVTVTGIGNWKGTIKKSYNIKSYQSRTEGSIYKTMYTGTVSFGSYPQTEIVDEAVSCGTYGRKWASDSDCYVDAVLYSELQNAVWDANGDTTIDDLKYHKLNKNDSINSDAANTLNGSWYYNWGDKTERYFRYEPIEWRVLEKDGDDLFLLANVGLDNQMYNDSKSPITWENSTIRQWLNSKFYVKAFNSRERRFIKITNVVNEDNKYYGTDGGNDTTDRIFLLSDDEVYGVRSVYYGFAENIKELDEARKIKSSTYAKAMGAFTSAMTVENRLANCDWWLRSPGLYSRNASYVFAGGNVCTDGEVADEKEHAVVPAIHVNLNNNDQIIGVESLVPEILSVSEITLDSDDFLYKGNPVTPKVTIKGLTEGTDYEVTYENNDKVGIGTVIVTGKGVFEGTYRRTFSIRDHKHCICGGSIEAGDHINHDSVTYQVWDGSVENNSPKGITYENGMAYVCLDEDVELEDSIVISDGNTLVLCLNGKELRRKDIEGTSDAQKKFIVKGGARLVICDCQGGGSIICGQSAGKGGAFYVENSSTLDIFGGRITGSSAEYGGAIALTDISPNGASKPSTMNIYGGEISGNTATKDGGAIYVCKNCKLNIYERPVVKDNTVGDKANNIFLTSGQKLSVIRIKNGASIGITTEDLDYPVAFTGAYDKDYKEYFHADLDGLHIIYNDSNELELVGNDYNVTLYPNNGTIKSGNVTGYTYGKEVKLPTADDISYTYYVFKGWFNNEGLTGEPVTAISATDFGDKKYYAKWEPCKYYVKLNTNGGTINSNNIEEYSYTKGATLPTDVTKTGYTFKGWYDNEEFTGEPVVIIGTTEVGERAYFAKWEANTYSVTLNTNNGTISNGNVTGYTYGQEITLPTADDITYTYHTFKGWYDNEELTGEPITSISATDLGDKTYYAKWEAYKYNVKLNTNGGTIGSNNVEDYIYGEGATLPTDIAKIGYTFKGWYTSEDMSGEPVEIIGTTEVGDKEYYAKWEINTYSVTLNTNGGTINSNNIDGYIYGEGATLPTDVTKTGYIFKGWYDNEELSGEPIEIIGTNEVDDREYFAKWDVIVYSITLNTNTGIINKSNYTYGQITALPTAEYINFTGHVFKGWYDNKELTGEPVTEISATDLGDKTFYAKWEHTNKKTTIIKATTSADGRIVESCSGCGKTLATTVITKVSTIKLSSTSYTYNGKTKKPRVKVTDAKGNIIPSDAYTVSYAKGRKNVGKYKVTVTLKGNYEGSKVLTFIINPKGTKISKVSGLKKSFIVKWKKKSAKKATLRITGYQIRYSTSPKMTRAKIKTVKGYKKTSKTITKLKAKRKYYVQIRTYKTVKGKKYFSSWSKVKSVKTK